MERNGDGVCAGCLHTVCEWGYLDVVSNEYTQQPLSGMCAAGQRFPASAPPRSWCHSPRAHDSLVSCYAPCRRVWRLGCVCSIRGFSTRHREGVVGHEVMKEWKLTLAPALEIEAIRSPVVRPSSGQKPPWSCSSLSR
jgi:hypothetical protein